MLLSRLKDIIRNINLTVCDMKLLLINVPICVAFCSCIDKNKNDEKIIGSVKRLALDTLSVKEIPLDFLLGNPNQIEMIDSLLIITDNQDEKALAICGYNGKLINRTLCVGEGPGECIMPIDISVSHGNKSLIVLQRQNGECDEYNINVLLNDSTPSSLNSYKFKGTDRIISTGSKYIGSGLYDAGSLRIYNKDGLEVKTQNIYPDYLNSIENATDKYRIAQGFISYSKNVIAYGTYFTGDISFFTYQDNRLRLINSCVTKPNKIRERIIRNPSDVSIHKDDIVHCIDICSSLNYFYVLYCGTDMGQVNQLKERYIMKFGTSGNLIQVYRVNARINSICVSNDDTKMYAIILADNLDYTIASIGIGT